jgi:hypothetical protein
MGFPRLKYRRRGLDAHPAIPIPRVGNSGTLLARLGLGTATLKSSRFFKNILNRPNFKMTLRKSYRKLKPQTI